MPKSLRDRLLEKGWSEEDIAKTVDALSSDEKNKKHETFKKAAHPLLYWIGISVAVIANLLLSLTLVPFLMFLKSFPLYIIIGVIGLAFGFVFKVLIKDIEHVDQKHHVVAGLFIPLVALVTVYVMVSAANRFNSIIKYENSHNPLIFGVIYVLCFGAPYLVYKILDIIHTTRAKM
jgi:hypothetical protein